MLEPIEERTENAETKKEEYYDTYIVGESCIYRMEKSGFDRMINRYRDETGVARITISASLLRSCNPRKSTAGNHKKKTKEF